VSLSEQLRQAIADSGMSLHRISIESGVAYAVVHGFANGDRDIAFSSAEKIAVLFGMRLTVPTRKKAGRRGERTPRRP